MEELGHLIETLLEAEATSACFCKVFHVSSHGATGKGLPGQRIETLVGDRRWIPFLQTNGALAPCSGAVHLAGAGGQERPATAASGQAAKWALVEGKPRASPELGESSPGGKAGAGRRQQGSKT